MPTAEVVSIHWRGVSTKLLRPARFLNPSNSRGFEIRVIQSLPHAKEFLGVTVSHPILDDVIGACRFPSGEASGDEGWLLKLELRKEVAPGWTATGFIDGGEIRQHKRTWAGWTTTNQPNRYGLAGAGIGLNWNKPGDFSMQLALAAPLGRHPGKTAAGKNQDGSAREARAWLRLAKYF